VQNQGLFPNNSSSLRPSSFQMLNQQCPPIQLFISEHPNLIFRVTTSSKKVNQSPNSHSISPKPRTLNTETHCVEPGLFPRRELEKINPMTAPSRVLFTEGEYLTHEKVQRAPQPQTQEPRPQISISNFKPNTDCRNAVFYTGIAPSPRPQTLHQVKDAVFYRERTLTSNTLWPKKRQDPNIHPFQTYRASLVQRSWRLMCEPTIAERVPHKIWEAADK
jgi:hypothetical protein